MDKQPNVGLFVTCLVDTQRPNVGFAAVQLLEQAGCKVTVPVGQTCCGQPAWNSGDDATSLALAKQTIEVFSEFDYVVAPSGSCAGTLVKHYPEMFEDEPEWLARANDLASRTHELMSFLVDVLAAELEPVNFNERVTYHDSCSGLRELNIREQPRELLQRCASVDVVEMDDRETCCGFGGTFCVKYPKISERMVDDKLSLATQTGASVVLGGDLGCLLNLAGRVSRLGIPLRVFHEPMSAKMQSHTFKQNASEALQDEPLQAALGSLKVGFIHKRLEAIELVPEWQRIRDEAKSMKDHVLANLDHYLLRYEHSVKANGGHVHWAETSAQAGETIVDICRRADAKTVAKGKSMVGEEAELNRRLEEVGIAPIETDLGEYIIQLADEPPSHIIAPAVHKTKEQVSELFHKHHQQYGLTERITDRQALVTEARTVLREKFRNADVGITGANFLIAETGQHVLVTNEGNGDLSSNLPRVHIVIVGIEKVVPNLEDASLLLRLLARSATGQHFSNYTSLMGGPKRDGDLDGPDEFHVVLVDNKRTELFAGELREMLRCFRCGACINHCPVYGAIGGHAYGWVYPGPMGSVISPAMVGLEKTRDLPHACTLNGRCAEVCPMSIPLPSLLRKHRRTTFEKQLQTMRSRTALAIWAKIALRPKLYRRVTNTLVRALSLLARGRGHIRRLPLAGAWTQSRNLPIPADSKTFISQYTASQKPERLS